MDRDKDENMTENEPEESKDPESEKSEEASHEDIPEDLHLPQPNFTTLVMMLSTNALGYLAELEKADPKKRNLLTHLARHTIDTIQVLDEKTKGNLDAEEKDIIDKVLADLRLQFIKFAGSS
jgi:hypothetical protein